MEWRSDIRLLEQAAKLCCTPCSSRTPLFDQVSHTVGAGVKVFCSAAGVNALMTSRMSVTREECEVENGETELSERDDPQEELGFSS